MQIAPIEFKLFGILIIAYLFGSISSAILLCRWLKLPDPRTTGSQNPGTTNMLRIAGKSLAAAVLLLDLLKGFAAVTATSLLSSSNSFIASAGIAVFLGQLFPVFFQFRGGKGIAVTLGVMLAWHWPLALLCLLVWVAIFAIYRISSLASLLATLTAITMSAWSLLHNNCLAFNLGELASEFAVSVVLLSAMIIHRHAKNIRQLISNTEQTIR